MTEKNKVRFGLERVHIAFRDTTAAEQPAWETPIHVPGVVSLSTTPEGGESAFYADNTKYYVRYVNNGYTGELEMAIFPDEILAEMLGWEIDDSGMLIEDADANAKEFALLAQVQGDARNRRFVFYRCTANRPSQTHATSTETITPTTETLTLTMLPIEVDEKKLIRAVIEPDETNQAIQAIYDAWFQSVTLPGGGA